jgi:hypothetical protein
LLGVQSAVALHLYKGGGLDPFSTVSRVNPAVLGNKSREKLGTLTDSTRARTVRATTADSPDREPSGLGAGPSALLFLELNTPLFWSVKEVDCLLLLIFFFPFSFSSVHQTFFFLFLFFYSPVWFLSIRMDFFLSLFLNFSC